MGAARKRFDALMDDRIANIPGVTPREDYCRERQVLPKSLPDGWSTLVPGRAGYESTSRDGLRVLMGAHIEEDGCVWLHVSFSRRTRIPDWKDTVRVKHIFIGENRKAISVFPPAAEYVNVHPRCLHLWCNLDVDLLPDFRWEGGI